jgi:hypothetical protein
MGAQDSLIAFIGMSGFAGCRAHMAHAMLFGVGFPGCAGSHDKPPLLFVGAMRGFVLIISSCRITCSDPL